MILPKEIRQKASAYSNLKEREAYCQGAIAMSEFMNIGLATDPVNEDAYVTTNEPTFEEFWEAYNYKKARKQCERMWNRLTRIQKSEIMQSIPPYLATIREKCYQMHPSTYINPTNERWKDEPTNRISKDRSAEQQELDYMESAARGFVASFT